MGVSETVIAAAIGAMATLTGAIFQLYTALRVKARAEQRPKRTGATRLVPTVVALMVACAAGGYIYAAFRHRQTNDDLRTVREDLDSMRADLNAKLQALVSTTEALALEQSAAHEAPDDLEVIVLAPGCEQGACEETDGAQMALCGTVPAGTRAGEIGLYVGSAPTTVSRELIEPEYRRVQLEQDAGGAKFTGNPMALPQKDGDSMLCVTFVHWSDEPHVARMVVQLAPLDVAPSERPGVAQLEEQGAASLL